MTHREREEQERVLRSLRRDARVLADRFQLRPRVIEAERANVKRRYGICYSDGTIRIRLRHVKTRRLLKYSSLVDTLCHELAHLRHFNHGERFQVFYRVILEYARRAGIYRPGPVRVRVRSEGAFQAPLAPVRTLRTPDRYDPEPRTPRPVETVPSGGVQLELF